MRRYTGRTQPLLLRRGAGTRRSGRRVGKNRRIGQGEGRRAGIGSLYSAFPVMLMTMSPETFFPFSVVGN